MSITIDKYKMSITDLEEIVISDIVADETSGGYTRKISFFTDPATTTNRTPILELWLYGTAQEPLKVHTPELEY